MSNTQIVSQGTFGVVRPGRTGPVVTSMLVQTKPDNAVLLSTGEWVPTATFSTLSETEQAYLRKHGVDAFNREQSRVAEQRIAALEPHKAGEGYNLVAMVGAGHTEQGLRDLGFSQADITEAQTQHKALATVEPYKVGDGYDLVAAVKGKVDVDTLHTLFTKEAVVDAHQAVGREGRVIIDTPVTGRAAFDTMVKDGHIHGLAEYHSYDEATGEVTYTAPKTKLTLTDIERHWGELEPRQQAVQINAALRKPIYDIYKPYDQLTADEQRQVLAFYTESYLPWQTSDKAYMQELWATQKAQLKDVGIGLIPVYGTIYHWDNMSPTWRVISIASDVAVIATAVRAAVVAIKAAKSPIAVKAALAVKAERALTKQMATKIQASYGKPVASAYLKMADAQADYVTALAKAKQLTAAGKVVPDTLKTTIVGMEARLRIAAKSFVSQLQPVAGFDSHDVAKVIASLPDDMVRNAKSLVAGLRATDSVKSLRAAVVRAEANLAAAKAQYPTDATKWADLAFEVARAEARLNQALTGGVLQLQEQLVAARKAGDTVKAARLERQLADALKVWEVEWGSGGALSHGGGVATMQAKPLAPTLPGIGGIRTAAPTAAVKGAAVVKAATVTVRASTGKPETTTAKPMTTVTPDTIRTTGATPEVITIATSVPEVIGVTDAQVIELSQVALATAVEAVAQGKTGTALHEAVENAVETAAETQTQTHAQTATTTQVKVITSTAIDTARKWKRRHIPSGRTRTGDKAGRREYPDGTIAWKQGRWWKIIPPPYDLDKPITADEPPAGVTRMTGSPQETLTFIGGKLPFGDVSFDLGVVDGHIDVKGKRIKFGGHGLRTNVGRRIQSRTKGVSLPGHASGAQSRRHGPVWVTRYPGDRQVALSRTKPGRRGRR